MEVSFWLTVPVDMGHQDGEGLEQMQKTLFHIVPTVISQIVICICVKYPVIPQQCSVLLYLHNSILLR